MSFITGDRREMRESKRRALESIAFEVGKRKEQELDASDRVEGVKRKKMEMITMMKRHPADALDVQLVGRDHEIKVIRAMIDQVGAGERPLLAGIPKCGKNAILRKLASQVAHPILKINCLDYVVRNGEEDALLVSQIMDIVRTSPNAVIYFQHINSFFSSEKVKQMLQMIYSQKISIIATVSMTAEEEEVRKISKFLQPYNSTLVKINDLSVHDARNVIRNKLAKYPLPHQITLSDDCFECAFTLAQKYYQDTSLVQRTLNLLRRAANLVHDDGRQQIDPKDFFQCIPDDIGVPREELLETPAKIRERMINTLNSKVIGQQGAVEILASRVFAYKSGFLDPNKPWGSYFFVGSTGVGKTELARQIALVLYGNIESCIRLDMVEYSEEHSVARLFGAPPGYEGHEVGGQLTEALKKNPRRIIIFDELEKAHRTVVHALLNAIDCGRLTDGRGFTVSLNDCLIIMTSNLGAESLIELARKKKVTEANIVNKIKPLINTKISPEFCNRITRIVGFLPVDESDYPKVVTLELQQRAAICQKRGIDLLWKEGVIDFMLAQEFDALFGMRDLRRVVEQKTLSALEKHACVGNPMEGTITLTVSGKELVCV